MSDNLKKLIYEWTSHYPDHPQYKEWQKQRLWQEKYQYDKQSILKPYLNKNKKILDLGCGMGGLTVSLINKHFKAYSLDFNYDYCLITKLRGLRNKQKIIPINAAAENLPLKNNLFDLIICFDVLEHVKNPIMSLKQMYQAIKPDGKVVISIINRYGFYDQHFHLYGINWLPRNLGGFITRIFSKKLTNHFSDNQKLTCMHYFTYSQFIKETRKIGFSNKDLIKEKIINPQRIKSRQLKIIIKILNFLHLTPPLYFLYNRFFINTFLIELTK